VLSLSQAKKWVIIHEGVAVSKTIVAMIASVALVFGALWFLSKNETPRRPTRPDHPSGSSKEVLVFCAAANQAVLEEKNTKQKRGEGFRFNTEALKRYFRKSTSPKPAISTCQPIPAF
jgi:hypothetical protein